VKISDSITHRSQQKQYSCGAACISMLLNVSEDSIRKSIKTTIKGTKSENVSEFLKSLNINHHRVYLKKSYNEIIDDLIRISFQFPLYLSGTYLWNNKGRGRPITRHHASLFCDGYIYDPAEHNKLSGESYRHTFNKSLIFNEMILIEEERSGFIKNFNNFFE